MGFHGLGFRADRLGFSLQALNPEAVVSTRLLSKCKKDAQTATIRMGSCRIRIGFGYGGTGFWVGAEKLLPERGSMLEISMRKT